MKKVLEAIHSMNKGKHYYMSTLQEFSMGLDHGLK